jgi:hypothetical protein
MLSKSWNWDRTQDCGLNTQVTCAGFHGFSSAINFVIIEKLLGQAEKQTWNTGVELLNTDLTPF